MKEIQIAEMFGPTIQGEGPNIGARCLFVRVSGCTFRCSWCDSKFTWDNKAHDITAYTPDELATYLHGLHIQHKCNRIVLTGGNPCMYDFSYVIDTLKDDVSFDVETQGDLLPEWLSMLDTVVFSPKPPSSGMPDTYKNIVKYILSHEDIKQTVAIKIPVFNQNDIEFARKYASFVNNVKDHGQLDVKMYLSVGNSDVQTKGSIRDRVLSDYENLLCTINETSENFENVYILPQLHTLVWGNRQGV